MGSPRFESLVLPLTRCKTLASLLICHRLNCFYTCKMSKTVTFNLLTYRIISRVNLVNKYIKLLHKF